MHATRGLRALGAVLFFVGVPRSAVAAPVSWTGGGDGTNWNDGLNWSGGVTPGPADDVTVNVAGSPSIVVAGASVSIDGVPTVCRNRGLATT